MSDHAKGAHILVVDDDPDHLALTQRWLQLAGMQVTAAAGGRQALAVMERRRPDLVVSDLMMEELDGMRLLSAIHQLDAVLPVILISGQAEVRDAIQAAHLGVSDFITKPIREPDLVAAVERALQRAGGKQGAAVQAFGEGLVYRSAAMVELVERARLVAMGDTTLLLSGETGTGKEELAKAIHRASPRRQGPFVSINCSAMPEHLLESELFGHEKGAFTGANSRHVGLFQAADKGTLFLDEIGDMPANLQAKLLRVLQDFQVRPVGALKAVPVDVRIISATHHDLLSMVCSHEFREDLYYRLNVVPLLIPPLRDRREDIPLLIEHFLASLAGTKPSARRRFSPKGQEYLLQAALPGNVRQLRNLVERCVVLSTSEVIPDQLVVEALADQVGEVQSLDEAKHAFEHRYLVGLLRTTNGNVSTAARMAGRNRTEFYKLLGRHGLDAASFRAEAESAGQ